MRCKRLYGRWHGGRKRAKNPFSLPLVRRAQRGRVVTLKPVALPMATLMSPGRPLGAERTKRKSRNDRRIYDWQRVPRGFDHAVTGRFTLRH
jgi:hypothetical protein